MKVTFSINLHDSDGDVYENGIFLHFGDRAIVRFEDYEELENFIQHYSLHGLKEIRENLGIEPQNIDN